jgi:hypothetical protein
MEASAAVSAAATGVASADAAGIASCVQLLSWGANGTPEAGIAPAVDSSKGLDSERARSKLKGLQEVSSTKRERPRKK